MGKKDNLIQIPGGGAADEMKEAIRELVDLITTLPELMKYQRAKYLAAVDAGFTEEQALELSKVFP